MFYVCCTYVVRMLYVRICLTNSVRRKILLALPASFVRILVTQELFRIEFLLIYCNYSCRTHMRHMDHTVT